MTELNSNIGYVDDIILRNKYPIPIRCYSPNFNEQLSVCVFIHGGGHMTGGI